jgi:Family of unknown function (DUF6893)
MKWKIVGGTVLAAIALGVAVNFKEIVRYVRISKM